MSSLMLGGYKNAIQMNQSSHLFYLANRTLVTVFNVWNDCIKL